MAIMGQVKGQRGMSLVEATIILLVLMLLTSVLAPSIEDYVNDAKDVKVKEDCEAIGTAIKRLERDVPGGCIKWQNGGTFNSTNGLCPKGDRADLLVSEQGNKLVVASGVNDSLSGVSNQNVANNIVGWTSSLDTNNVSSLDKQLVTNDGPNYKVIQQKTYDADNKNTFPGVGGFALSGPQFNRGWRGAYVSPTISADPWGDRYMVNSVFLKVASDAGAETEDGYYGWNRDVFCLSAGPNLRVETDFDPETGNTPSTNKGTRRKGDDFVYVISGSSR